MNRYWRRLRTSKHPVRLVIAKLLLESGLCRLFRIPQDGFVLRFYPTNQSKFLWTDPNYKTSPHNAGDEQTFFRRYLRAGDVVLDIGANIGLTSLTAATRVGASGKVFAIEPHPRIFKFLKGNVSINRVQNVHLYNLALGNSSGKVGFADGRSDDHNSVLPAAAALEVSMVRLDDLNFDRQPIALLKIDVEGYEKFVLEGAAATLPLVECIYFESWAQHYAKFNYSCSDVLRILAGAGFRVFRAAGSDRLTEVGIEYSSSVCENLIATRDLHRLLERTGLSQV
jgi:FkbM family methyltransferase